jgi:hypothetical protein
MPLIQPRKVTEIQDWYLIKQDSHLILEKKTPVKKAFGQTVTNYRILLKFNRQQVAQATSEKDILECWTQLQPSPEVNSFVQVQALNYAPGHLFALIDQLYKKELEEIGITLKPTHQDEAEYLANIYSVVQELKTIYEHEGTNRLNDESTKSLIGMLCLVSRSCLDCSKNLLLKRLLREVIDNRADPNQRLLAPEDSNNSDKSHKQVVDELELRTHFVDNVNSLYTTETKLNEDLSNINNRIRRIENIPTQAFTRDAVFYVPIIDEVNKAFDTQFIDQILTNDEAISDVELEEKVFEYFDQVFMQMQDPITVAVRNTSKLLEGRLREKMIRAGKVLSSPTNNSNLKLSQSIDSTPSSVIDSLKEDLAQLLEIFKASFQLSFPNLSARSTRVLSVIKYVLGDIFAANLHALLLEYYKSVNGEKDSIASLKCSEFKKQASFDKIGINKKFWDALKDQSAINDISKFGALFVKTNSIIKKLRFLDQMATQLCQHAASRHKKQESIGADDFLPLVTYIMIQANIPFIYSELEFIADFIPETHLLGKNGYLLVSVQAAMHHILIMDTLEARDLARVVGSSTNSNNSSRRSSIVSDISDDNNRMLITPVMAQLSTPTKSRASSSGSADLQPPTPEGSRMNFDEDSSTGGSPAEGNKFEQFLNGNNSLYVLNGEPPGLEIVNDTEQAINLSIKLISCIVSIYKKHCKMVNTTKEFQAAAEFIHEDEFYRAFVTDTSQLHSVTAIGMTEHQKIVFFVNIYHSLLLHSYVEMDSIPDSNFSKISHARSVGYQIGGCAISLLAMEHEILRACSHRPAFFGSGFLISKSPRGGSVSQLALTQAYPQISFLLCTLTKSGPPVRVVTMENVESILHHAAYSYISKEVLVEKKVINLPKLVDWFKKDFGSSTSSVLKWIGLYLPTERKNQFTQLLHANSYRIAFKPYEYGFKFETDSPDEAALDLALKHHRTSLVVQVGDGPVIKQETSK